MNKTTIPTTAFSRELLEKMYHDIQTNKKKAKKKGAV